eukprot:GHVU01138270.1.p1 GENE.GHVU01138270.1~~GHVU01138270.1.p1  ORF type:complete len:143 (+),score=12.71 GHVU01138270.1:571-999(+)
MATTKVGGLQVIIDTIMGVGDDGKALLRKLSSSSSSGQAPPIFQNMGTVYYLDQAGQSALDTMLIKIGKLDLDRKARKTTHLAATREKLKAQGITRGRRVDQRYPETFVMPTDIGVLHPADEELIYDIMKQNKANLGNNCVH